MNERKQGTVKWFNDAKGFGFIAPDDGEKDVFVHKTGIQGANSYSSGLNDGDRVEFSVEQTPKGLNAVNVTKI
jgi:CspA family cold shock protein